MTCRRRILLTSLSPRPWDAKYFLNEKTAVAKQSPLALLQLLPLEEMPENIIILCTDEIKAEQFAVAKEEMLVEMKKRGVRINERDIVDLSIPDGKTSQELWEILKAILDNVPSGVRLTLDITHGFRSFPFVFFTAAVFLKALRDVDIRAVYYGMLAEGQGPMVDLSLILDMVEWFYATRIFNETGQAQHLNALLAKLEIPPEETMEENAYAPYSKIKTLRTALEDFASSYTQALPIEMGLISAQVIDKLSKTVFNDEMREKIPVPDELMNIVKEFIKPLALPLPSKRNQRNKDIIPLHVYELERQARLIDSYLNRGYLNYALGLMREWMVSAALMYNEAATDTEAELNTSWLDYDHDRKPIEDRLNDLAYIMEYKNSEDKELLTDEQKWLGSKWKLLRKKRNQLAHHGYRPDFSLQSPEHIDAVSKAWQEMKEKLHNQSWWQLELKKRAAHGTLLISPLGLSKGLLFSALKHTNPSRAVIITSRQSFASIEEIISKAEWKGEFTVLPMEEPFTGFDEAEEIIHRIQPVLEASEKVVVNITGGTTAMQYIVQEVADSALKQQLDLKKAALIDRRPPAEQKANPYVLGEIVWLKDKKENNS